MKFENGDQCALHAPVRTHPRSPHPTPQGRHLIFEVWVADELIFSCCLVIFHHQERDVRMRGWYSTSARQKVVSVLYHFDRTSAVLAVEERVDECEISRTLPSSPFSSPSPSPSP